MYTIGVRILLLKANLNAYLQNNETMHVVRILAALKKYGIESVVNSMM